MICGLYRLVVKGAGVDSINFFMQFRPWKFERASVCCGIEAMGTSSSRSAFTGCSASIREVVLKSMLPIRGAGHLMGRHRETTIS